MLLYKVFGNFREALLVLVNLPLAMIAFVTLFGIAARNGIILMSRYNQR